MTNFEYKFVRIGESRTSALFGVQDKARKTYEDVAHEHARDGWRLVQIFAPGVAAFGAAKYYELIFEREVRSERQSAKADELDSAEDPVGAGANGRHFSARPRVG